MRKLDDSKIEDIRTLVELGASAKEISEELHINYRTALKYAGVSGHRHVDDKLMQKMLELQNKGLSHQQIGIELGLSYATVHKHLGDQKDMNRSNYGSIVSHVTGNSFVQQENVTKLSRKNQLTQISSSVSYQGECFTYKISTDGKVRLSNVLGTVIDFDKDQFIRFVSELCELENTLTDFTAKSSNQYIIGLDGKVRA